MIQILKNSAVTENSTRLEAGSTRAAKLVIEVRDGGGWNGTIKVNARARGRGAAGAGATWSKYLPITNLETGANILAGTGITAPGLYSVDITGLEVRLEHTRTAGTVHVDGNVEHA